MHFSSHHGMRRALVRSIALAVLLCIGWGMPAWAVAASSWNPTLLVNTESFSTIDDGDGTTNIQLKFGDTLKETVTFNRSAWRFDFSQSIYVNGNITATGSLSIKKVMSGAALRVDNNADIWGKLSVSGATLIDGNLSASGVLAVEGAAAFGSTLKLNGVTYTFPGGDGTASGKVLKTNAAGQLSWSSDIDTDTDTNTTYSQGQGLTLNGTVFSLSAAHSGSTINASTVLASSGTIAATNTISTRGNITLNGDNGAADAVLTFGNDSGAETLKFNDTTNQFELSDDLAVTGKLSATDTISGSGTLAIESDAAFGGTLKLNGVTYTFPGGDGTASGKVLKTNGAGQLSWSADTDTDTNTTYSQGQGLTLNGTVFSLSAAHSGSTINASTVLASSGTIAATNTISTRGNITLNGDNGAADAVLTFGNDSGAETLKFNDTLSQFELSDDLAVTDSITSSGSVQIESNLAVGGTLKINGVTYTFPGGDGTASGKVLKTNGAGQLSWSADSTATGVGSGGVLFLSPEYPHAVYVGSGSSIVGQLSAAYDSTNKENYYHWASTKTTPLQEYTIAVRIRVPDNFSAWDTNQPIQLRYRTGDDVPGNNIVSLRMQDTAGAKVTLTGGENLAATSWTTATVTGPQAAGTYTKTGYITLFIKLAAKSTGSADAGYININWETSAP